MSSSPIRFGSFNELEDPLARTSIYLLKEILVSALKFGPAILGVEGLSRKSPMVMVLVPIHLRIIECCGSTNFLLSRSRIRDAAALICTLIELRTDLGYMSRSPARMQKWIDHDNTHNVPWTMGKKITSIYSDATDQRIQGEIYRYYCAVKHGNPKANEHAFMAFPTEFGVDVSKNDGILRTIHYARDAATEIRSSMGFLAILCAPFSVDLTDIINEIETPWMTLNEMLYRRIVADDKLASSSKKD